MAAIYSGSPPHERELRVRALRRHEAGGRRSHSHPVPAQRSISLQGAHVPLDVLIAASGHAGERAINGAIGAFTRKSASSCQPERQVSPRTRDEPVWSEATVIDALAYSGGVMRRRARTAMRGRKPGSEPIRFLQCGGAYSWRRAAERVSRSGAGAHLDARSAKTRHARVVSSSAESIASPARLGAHRSTLSVPLARQPRSAP